MHPGLTVDLFCFVLIVVLILTIHVYLFTYLLLPYINLFSSIKLPRFTRRVLFKQTAGIYHTAVADSLNFF